VAWCFAAVCLYGVACTVALSLERAFGAGAAIGALAGVTVVAVIVLLGFRKADAVASLFRASVDRFENVSDRAWLGSWIAVGWALRIVWLAAVPQVATSDYRSYFGLAVGLVERGTFGIDHVCFHRPPGISLALAPLVALFGTRPWLPWLLNLALFIALMVVVFWLGRAVAGTRVARVAVVLVAVWPNALFLSGLASKELLLLTLVSAAMFAYIVAAEGLHAPPSAARAVTAGLLTGASALTQPTALLLPAGFALYEWLRGSAIRGAAVRLALLVGGAVLVVAPWTARNWQASGELLLVSANGGHALWVGNNPEATGGHVDLLSRYRDLGEIEYNRQAYRWALEWIRSNPRRFLELTVRRQVLYLGDDADGAYATLRRGLAIGDLRYAAAKGISNGFWTVLLALAALAVVRHRGGAVVFRPNTVLLMLPMLGQLAVFSITESGGRHHVAVTGLLVILAALIVYREE
jgi:4-amino-4-deoxy-L-arabinose transferase-like glycosyltransferase